MSESVDLVESRPRVIALDRWQLDEIARLSSDLAGSREWWGSDPEGPAPESRALSVEARGGGRYAVTVHNAIGTIGLPGLTIVVRPKIPMQHFVHIALSGLLVGSRSDQAETFLSSGMDFSELVSIWLIEAARRLIKQGLEYDYQTVESRISIARGSIDIPATVNGWLMGDPSVRSSFDEFSSDSPLNRVLKAALSAVSGNPDISEMTRWAAAGLVSQLWEVGSLEQGDLIAAPRRGQIRYIEPLRLARQILGAVSRGLSGGPLRSATFLFPTPSLIEEGIRSILTARLEPILVRKHGRVLVPSTVSVNPDLEIGPPPFTGDVKYKLSDASWNRPDLAQAVFFATAYSSPLALVVNFRNVSAREPDLLRVGSVRVGVATWDAQQNADPRESEDQLVERVRQVLGFVFARQES